MAYELRLDRTRAGIFERPEQALDEARAALKRRPDCEPEIFDTVTGKPFAPASSRSWREHLANEVGF
jgi:hypothetical protein